MSGLIRICKSCGQVIREAQPYYSSGFYCAGCRPGVGLLSAVWSGIKNLKPVDLEELFHSRDRLDDFLETRPLINSGFNSGILIRTYDVTGTVIDSNASEPFNSIRTKDSERTLLTTLR